MANNNKLLLAAIDATLSEKSQVGTAVKLGISTRQLRTIQASDEFQRLMRVAKADIVHSVSARLAGLAELAVRTLGDALECIHTSALDKAPVALKILDLVSDAHRFEIAETKLDELSDGGGAWQPTQTIDAAIMPKALKDRN